MSTGKAIGYAFGASVAASFATLLVGACLFGFQFADWTEWQGGLLGLVGALAGIGGAVVGLRLAACGERRARS